MLFYVLFILLPMIFFIHWYTQTLMRDRTAEIKYEKQQLLEQSVQVFNNQVLEAETVNTLLRQNASMLKLLQNRYTKASEEIYFYLTDVLTTIKGVPRSHPSIDEVFIYRYTDSALKDSDIIYYLVNVRDFSYDKTLLEIARKNGFVWFAEMDPVAARHDKYYTKNIPTSPKLIYISRIYDERYNKVIGFIELQVNLDRLMQSMDFFRSSESLFIKTNGEYYSIGFSPDNTIQYDKIQNSIPEAGAEGFGLAKSTITGTNIEFIYQYQVAELRNPVLLKSILMAAMLLIVPALFLLLYIYHFTGRLSKFSNHIKLMHGENLTPYDGGKSRDEFGVVVSEYNRMTQTITLLIESVYIAEQRKNEANYYAMQSQVDPHFLFNTLENIRLRADMKEYDSVSDMLFALSRLLRYNISMRRESTLLSELGHIRHYLLIYQCRRKDRINFTIDIPDGFQDIKCPFCILQPIVENCFKHGLKNSTDVISVTIALRNEENSVVVEIRDNGSGMTDAKLELINHSLAKDLDIETSSETGSVGLKNVNSRLRIFYGEQYGISFLKNEPRGMVCIMRLGKDPLIDLPAALRLSSGEATKATPH